MLFADALSPLFQRAWVMYMWVHVINIYCSLHHILIYYAGPHSSVSSVADLRTGGRWFDPWLRQYSFRGLMIVIATGFIPLSPLSIVSTNVIWESSQWLGKNVVCQLKKFQVSIDRCTGRRDITEILLKTALNTVQSINLIYLYSINPHFGSSKVSSTMDPFKPTIR